MFASNQTIALHTKPTTIAMSSTCSSLSS